MVGLEQLAILKLERLTKMMVPISRSVLKLRFPKMISRILKYLSLNSGKWRFHFFCFKFDIR